MYAWQTYSAPNTEVTDIKARTLGYLLIDLQYYQNRYIIS